MQKKEDQSCLGGQRKWAKRIDIPSKKKSQILHETLFPSGILFLPVHDPPFLYTACQLLILCTTANCSTGLQALLLPGGGAGGRPAVSGKPGVVGSQGGPGYLQPAAGQSTASGSNGNQAFPNGGLNFQVRHAVLHLTHWLAPT